MSARARMPLVGNVSLIEDYQTDTVLNSSSNRTISDDLDVRCGEGGKGLKRKVSLLAW